MTTQIDSVTLDDLAKLLQEAGFRAETLKAQDGTAILRSATAGIGFSIRPGNPVEAGFIDFTYTAPFRVEARVLEKAAGEWNAAKRFSRLYGRDGLLLLEMDVLVAGGVGHAYLRATLEIWNRLLSEALLYLRDVTQRLLATSNVMPSA